MKEYLLLFRSDEGRKLQQSPEKWRPHSLKWMQWLTDVAESGKFVSAQPLATTGRLVTGPGKVVTDGPFMEGKEMVGGYLVCKANDYDDAIDVSNGCPILEFDDGVVEVREIQEMKMS